MARPAVKEVLAQRMLLEYLDDDFVFRNQEVLQHLVKTDLEILSRDTLDAMECLLQLAIHYRAEILKLQTREMRQNVGQPTAPARQLGCRIAVSSSSCYIFALTNSQSSRWISIANRWRSCRFHSSPFIVVLSHSDRYLTSSAAHSLRRGVASRLPSP